MSMPLLHWEVLQIIEKGTYLGYSEERNYNKEGVIQTI